MCWFLTLNSISQIYMSILWSLAHCPVYSGICKMFWNCKSKNPLTLSLFCKIILTTQHLLIFTCVLVSVEKKWDSWNFEKDYIELQISLGILDFKFNKPATPSTQFFFFFKSHNCRSISVVFCNIKCMACYCLNVFLNILFFFDVMVNTTILSI